MSTDGTTYPIVISVHGYLPKVSDKVAWRRLRIAGRCQRHEELPAYPLFYGSQATASAIQEDPHDICGHPQERYRGGQHC